MPRIAVEENEAVNADSFLDIVASVVSVLIIMVMVTGLKIKNTPIEAPPSPEAAQSGAALARDLTREQSIRDEVLDIQAEIRQVEGQAAVQSREQDRLAGAVRGLEQHVEAVRRERERPTPQDLETAEELAAAHATLAQLERERAAAVNGPAPTERVQCYPTPLGRTVEGREVHFQLRGGRITLVPIQELIEAGIADAKRKLGRLDDRHPEMTDAVGPIDGFRGNYTIQLHEYTPDEARQSGRHGTGIRVKRFTFVPLDERLGETLAEALAEGSQFHLILSERRLRDATVTVWVYPDSFAAFRRVKQDLYRLGFPVAARPLPDGAPISASPSGSKSTAE